MSGQKPEDFINAITGRPVILKLVTGEIIKGILVSIDSMFFSFLFSSTFSQFFFSIYSPFIPLIPYTNHPFLPISSHPPYPSPSPIIPFYPLIKNQSLWVVFSNNTSASPMVNWSPLTIRPMLEVLTSYILVLIKNRFIDSGFFGFFKKSSNRLIW